MIKFIEEFHKAGDGDDFSPAMARAQSSTGTAALPAGFSLYFQNKTYKFSQTIRLRRSMSLIGSGGAGWYAGTVFQFPAGMHGLVCEYDPGHMLGSAAWSIVERIKFLGGGASATAAHGITMHARMNVRDCYITAFNGDGIHIEASAPDANANNWLVSNVRIDNCAGDGLLVTGTDANAGCATMLDSSSNLGYGVRDNSFLGNTYVACHAAANGGGAYTTRKPAAPSDPNARSLFLNCYQEQDQTSQVDDPAIVLGGFINLTPDSTSVWMQARFGEAQFDNGVVASNRQTPLVTAILGSNPGVALTFADDTPWPYRLHAPSGNATWWELSWAESVVPLRFSRERPGVTPDVPGGRVWMENGFYLGPSDGRVRVLTGSAIPAVGTFSIGDRIMNVTPAVGGYAGWICTASGTPGTWAGFGKIEPV
jgi:hypothetical protein